MKKLAKAGVLAGVFIFLLPALVPAALISDSIQHPWGDSSFTGYGFYEEGTDMTTADPASPDGIVWARNFADGTDPTYGAVQRFEYQVENFGLTSSADGIGSIIIELDEPFWTGGTLSNIDPDTRFAGATPVLMALETASTPTASARVEFIFLTGLFSNSGGDALDTAGRQASTSAVFFVRSPWEGMGDASLQDGTVLEGKLLTGIASSTGGDLSHVPEPATLLLLGSGLLGAGFLRLRRKIRG